MLRNILVDHFHYPKPLKQLQFDPNFAIRGLHFGMQSPLYRFSPYFVVFKRFILIEYLSGKIYRYQKWMVNEDR
jgi:hypothetical protein